MNFIHFLSLHHDTLSHISYCGGSFQKGDTALHLAAKNGNVAVGKNFYLVWVLTLASRTRRKNTFQVLHELVRQLLKSVRHTVTTPRNLHVPSSSRPVKTAADPAQSSIPFAEATGGHRSSVPAPLEYLCSITGDLMDTPVVAADGYCYEKSAIEEWLSKHNTSPMTNSVLPNEALVVCHTLRTAILDWKQANNVP
ncbi:hypothetical protein Pelo_6822 [Pelomyxa schiedti]|nr:hypothetical protein Pelo_6822 [Pelomyxa schiedti]